MKEQYNYITMIERSSSIIEELYKSSVPLGISEIAKTLDLPKATIYRILITLAKSGFVEKDENDDKYKLGTIYIKYSDKVKSQIDIHNIAEPFMEELAKEIGETVNLAISRENSALNLSRIEGEETVLVSKLIAIAPYYCSSVGKILLSYKSKEEIEEYFKESKIKKRTINTIDNYGEFLEEREKILKNKYAVDDEEYDYGLFCVACPIINSKKEIIAAVGFSGPKSRIEYKGKENMIKKLILYTKSINDKIGIIGI